MRTAVRLVLKLSEHPAYQAVVSEPITSADQELASHDLLVASLLTHADYTTIPMAERMADVIIKGHPSGPGIGLSVDGRISATAI